MPPDAVRMLSHVATPPDSSLAVANRHHDNYTVQSRGIQAVPRLASAIGGQTAEPTMEQRDTRLFICPILAYDESKKRGL